MKKIHLLLLIIIVAFIGCSDDDNPTKLPPATQTGAGTFACMVNGKAFVDTSGGYFNCFYQLVDGEYYFGIQGKDNTRTPESITIGSTKKTISQNEHLILTNDADGNMWGGARFKLNINSSQFSSTDEIHKGELVITKLDFDNHIVSGTFWMDLINPYTGELVEIRDGRFDTLFTQ
jgi:hypothetical protein